MTLPFLATLAARARLAFPIIQGGVRQGLSANAIQTILRTQDLGIRRQTLLDVIRAEKGIAAVGSQLRSMRLGMVPDPRRLPDALTKLRRAFSFEVKISGFDLATGEDVTRFVTVTLDNPLTRREIEAIGLSFIEEDMERYGIAVTDVIIERGVKAGTEGTFF